MSADDQGTKRRRKLAENLAEYGAQTLQTDRQTDHRQRDGQATAYRERELLKIGETSTLGSVDTTEYR